MQIATATIDITGLCLFVAFAVLDNQDGLPIIGEMINAQYGLNLTVDDMLELGRQILKTEREFNLKAWFGNADDRLLEFFLNEEMHPHNTSLTCQKVNWIRCLIISGVSSVCR